MDAAERLSAIAAQLTAKEIVQPVTVREFLTWFNSMRRTNRTVALIRHTLSGAGLETVPDFEPVYQDSQIQFCLVASTEAVAEINAAKDISTSHSPSEDIGENIISPTEHTYIDPTHRISKLAAANSPPLSVNPDATLAEAATLMSVRGYSQLPVMTSVREVKGVISWASIAPRMAFGNTGGLVRDFMESPHYEVRADASIFQAIPIIVQHDYVLVRSARNEISGIVTASDLSLQFLQLSEPFLLLGEIENYIRQMIADKFPVAELKNVCDPSDVSRQVNGVDDLTFGEYVRLLENKERWEKLSTVIDRSTFCKNLDRVREIRNDVMHFDPDGISPDDLEQLREFARFLQKLKSMGVS